MAPGQYVRTPEIRAKHAAYRRGREATPATRAKLSDAFSGERHPGYGKHRTPEVCAAISAAQKGPGNHFWMGGISFEPYCPLFDKNLKRRVRAFFDYHCIRCGKSTKENGRELCCHHVEYNKQACCDGKPVQFAALCMKCHNETNFDRERWEMIFHRIIDEIYGGRSYYTKEEFRSKPPSGECY